jgi:O-methyltransferase
MPRVVLEDVTAEQLMLLGDAALRLGRPQLALGLYQSGCVGRPLTGADHTRLGLAQAGTPISQKMLQILGQVLEISPTVFVGEGLATWSKAAPFIEDARFLALAQKHAHLLPVVNWHWNLQTVLWAAKQTLEVEGDFVELGVYRGHTTAFIADYLAFQAQPRTWFLYDTFDGIPDDQLDEGWAEKNQAAYRGERMASLEAVTAQFAAFPNIKVIKGRVPEVLAEPPTPDKIAFLHIDLNNATAEVAALDALFDRITPGGVIVFDDYAWAVSHRQRAAEDAWFAKRGLSILPLPTGQGLFFKR